MKARCSSSENELKIKFPKQECLRAYLKDERDVTEFTEGTIKRSLAGARRLRFGGIVPGGTSSRLDSWIILKVMNRTLNIIRDSTGSQCRSRRAGLISYQSVQ